MSSIPQLLRSCFPKRWTLPLITAESPTANVRSSCTQNDQCCSATIVHGRKKPQTINSMSPWDLSMELKHVNWLDATFCPSSQRSMATTSAYTGTMDWQPSTWGHEKWIYYWTNARQHGIYLFYTIKNIQLQLFISKSFSVTQNLAFAHFGKNEKKPFDGICCLYKMKQFHWLLCITRNCDWSRKITPLSNLTQMASCGMKTYSESRTELWNLQMLKEMLEKSTQFLSSE